MDKMNKSIMDEYNKIASKIKVSCPVHKINFDEESPNMLGGMYLITNDNAKDVIDKIADKSNLKDTTYLVFEVRHIVECCQFFLGVFVTIKENIPVVNYNYMDYIIHPLMRRILEGPIMYKDLNNIIDELIFDYLKRITTKGSKIYNNFISIFHDLWFVPYGQLDELVKNAVKEYEDLNNKGSDDSE